MTTTFADIKLTEDVQYHFENEDYKWSEGDVISLPRHTARKFVHNWDKAEWTETKHYEVREDEYEEIAARVRNSDEDNDDGDEDEDYSYDELQEIAKENDVAANQSAEGIKAELDEEGVEY